MSFTPTYNTVSVMGNKRTQSGTYTNTSGSTGGTIATGLNRIESFSTSTDTTQAATTNKTVITAGSIVLTTVADEDGNWFATGY